MKKLIIANWKMHGSKSFTTNFFNKINRVKTVHEIVVCLPYPYLYIGAKRPNLNLGAQDCHDKNQGAYTGDVSPSMLYDMGCKYVILGHSERRIGYNETNKKIKAKALLAINNNLIPIICVGEKERNEDERQLLKQCEESLTENCIIAYEPIWAIGTNITPTINEIKHQSSLLNKKYDLPVIYGGSINENNSTKILNISSISGLLIGKSSLNPEIFLQIIAAANES
ncbi:MAG: triosephosphate isomerase [Rickettsiaceae bacterium H1]|nr:triosephosphate isomerase [Rickettsiaceae bacterium H1]